MMSTEEHQRKYMQALARQSSYRECGVVLIECLPDCYRYTCRSGKIVKIDMEWGKKHHPIVICGRE
jgi:hypothetical protein